MSTLQKIKGLQFAEQVSEKTASGQIDVPALQSQFLGLESRLSMAVALDEMRQSDNALVRALADTLSASAPPGVASTDGRVLGDSFRAPPPAARPAPRPSAEGRSWGSVGTGR